jgi:hypothetical protein
MLMLGLLDLVAHRVKVAILTGAAAQHFLPLPLRNPACIVFNLSILMLHSELAMVRKLICVAALVVMLLYTTACGRARSGTSDTPVPTPVAAAVTAEVEATEVPTVEPTIEFTVEPTVEATNTAAASPTTTEEVTASEEVTITEEVTGTGEATTTNEVTATEEVSAPEELTATVEAAAIGETAAEEVTATGVMTSVATSAVSTEVSPTETITTSVEGTATKAVMPTLAVTATEPATAEPTETATPSAGVTATTTVTEGAEITATIRATDTTEVTSTVQVSDSQEAVARQVIELPTDLPTSVQITRVVPLNDVIEAAVPTVAELSPDGNLVAWMVPEEGGQVARICLADTQGRARGCEAIFGYEGLPYRLAWSPNSIWVAFSEDPSAQALESDIWLLNVTNGELTNRTDEQANGRYAAMEEAFTLDYLPMWDPATGYLYFWRSTPNAVGSFDLALMRLDPMTETEPEMVRSLTELSGDGVVRFGWQRFYLQGPSAIAPDGSQLAVVIAAAQEMDVAESEALWLIDLTDDSVEPQQLATALTWQSALPQWSSQPATARGLQWTEDGQGIVVAALSNDLRLPLLLAYYVDAETGDTEPVVDFSASRDRNSFFRYDPARGHPARFEVPWTIALAPNANVLLMVTDLGGVATILSAPLPPTGAAPAVLHTLASPGYEVWTRASSGENGFVLVYGLLLESEPLE